MQHAFVAFAGCTGFVGIDARDNQNFIFHFFLHFAQAGDVFNHRSALSAEQGPIIRNKLMRSTRKNISDFAVALGFHSGQFRRKRNRLFDFFGVGSLRKSCMDMVNKPLCINSFS